MCRGGTLEHRCDRIGCGRERFPWQLHGVEHAAGDAPHQLVLRLVLHARRAAMRADEEQRDPKDIGQGGQRAHRIAEPGVLDHDRCSVAADRRTGRRGHGIAFVCRGDIGEPLVIDDVVDEGREERAGDARIPFDPAAARGFDEVLCFDHLIRTRHPALRCEPEKLPAVTGGPGRGRRDLPPARA